jgi:uncharacterized protein YegP (UPF0339 family)
MAKKIRIQFYKRKDGLWEWRSIASNGQITATSGSQGYTRRATGMKSLKAFTKAVQEGRFIVEIM